MNPLPREIVRRAALHARDQLPMAFERRPAYTRVSRTCFYCHGAGGFWLLRGFEACDTCDGTGRVHPWVDVPGELRIPAGAEPW